jgi:hypothetical protein
MLTMPPGPSEEAPQYPPLWRQAASAAAAVGRFVAAGLPVADQTELERRLAICQGCEHFFAPHQRCVKCGCNGKWKAKLYSDHCPIGRW